MHVAAPIGERAVWEATKVHPKATTSAIEEFLKWLKDQQTGSISEPVFTRFQRVLDTVANRHRLTSVSVEKCKERLVAAIEAYPTPLSTPEKKFRLRRIHGGVTPVHLLTLSTFQDRTQDAFLREFLGYPEFKGGVDARLYAELFVAIPWLHPHALTTSVEESTISWSCVCLIWRTCRAFIDGDETRLEALLDIIEASWTGPCRLVGFSYDYAPVAVVF